MGLGYGLRLRALLLLLLPLCFCCGGDMVYSHYENTDLSGWQKEDTLFYNVPKMRQGGRYREELSLRGNGFYPFKTLEVIVEQCVLPRGEVLRDTVPIEMMDRRGNIQGRGMSVYNYSQPLRVIDLSARDSLIIKIRHNMKRELLPGISDIGIQIRLGEN